MKPNDPNNPSPDALRVARLIVTKRKGERRKKPRSRPVDGPPSDLFWKDDWRVGLDDETPQTGDKPT